MEDVSVNSKWQANRIGLVDFWYYDEEEFYFLDGRMLLRGSNGSGKSVTMQSFIPLLLDGNIQPSRLDPFGSRARRMENYLLEENDVRDERTGYLYMEFKRLDTTAYITIGMGMRARKNKPMDRWYFVIQDGRRVNQDFPLYKEGKEKLALSKIELKNRIGEGGRVFEAQSEYMEMVNKQLFGFDTIEEYKEMLELLIQLRTPKLSKDFKPSVLNDILGNSLAPLSEDDLRPMSEAIENMDSMKTDLEALKGSYQAAKKIQKEYDKYNQSVLLEKAHNYLEMQGELDKFQKDEKDKIAHQEVLEIHYQDACEKVISIEQEEELLKKEEASLGDSDAKKLERQKQELEGKLENCKKDISVKERNYTQKKEQSIEVESKQKSEENTLYLLEEQLHHYLDDMEEEINDISFQEYDFMRDELLEHPEKPYPFEMHRKNCQVLEQQVIEVKNKLVEEKHIRNQYDGVIQKLDGARRQRSGKESQWRQAENQLIEIRSELIEKIHVWNNQNVLLKLDVKCLQEIENLVQNFKVGFDYEPVRNLVRVKYEQVYQDFRNVLFSLEDKWNVQKQVVKETQIELEKWKAKKDPEPERENVVVENRKRLEKAGIPYIPFYQAMDFQLALTDQQKNDLEEALFRMGILDAIIVSSQYKKQILKLDPGTCDRYIFDEVEQIKKNVSALLEVDYSDNDQDFYDRISKVLSGIGMDTLYHTTIHENGAYQLGILSGTITKQYTAKYIGAKARETFRLSQIAKLEKKLLEMQVMEAERKAEVDKQKESIVSLSTEKNALPKDEDLRIAIMTFDKAEKELSQAQQMVKEFEVEETKVSEELKRVRNEAQLLANKLELPAIFDTFVRIEQGLRKYSNLLGNLQITHNNYCNSIVTLESYKEQFEDLQMDLDDILYDLNKFKAEGKRLEGELESIHHQLSLTNYEDVKERLSYCVKRLESIPKERIDWITKREQYLNKIENGKHDLMKIQENIALAMANVQALERVFLAERQLHYVQLTEEVNQAESVAEMAKWYVQSIDHSFLGLSEELRIRLQDEYLKNRSELVEYNLEIITLFGKEEGKNISGKRIDIRCSFHTNQLSFLSLIETIDGEIQEQESLLNAKDRELFEDILMNTISKKIRAKIHKSENWVDKMNQLMGEMNTSSGLKLNLKWKPKHAEHEGQMDTKELVELLKKDTELMRVDEFEKLSAHFRSKVAEARKLVMQTENDKSFHLIMKEVLDYRKWFEFTLESRKTDEKKKELTDRVFFTFSGGEKAMSMYVPLFSAVVAKYEGARADAPKLISLDEAFAGVDEMNIKDMFRLMVEFDFDFIINSQILYGDYDTVPNLAIYQLHRPENAKFVSVIRYVWNGKKRDLVQSVGDMVEERG